MLVNDLQIRKVHVALMGVLALIVAALAIAVMSGNMDGTLDIARYIRRYFGLAVKISTLTGILNAIVDILRNGATLWAAVVAVIGTGGVIGTALLTIGRAALLRLVARYGLRGAAQV